MKEKPKRVFTEEHRKNISKSAKGKIISAEARKKIGSHCTGKKNYRWQGDKASYRSIHQWMNNWFGRPTTCEHCKTENLTGHKIHWASKTAKYIRKRENWLRLCVKCHWAHDRVNRIKKLKKTNAKKAKQEENNKSMGVYNEYRRFSKL